MKMIVFSEGIRDRVGPPSAGESMFAYLDTSSREEARKARQTIESWVADYPPEKLDHWLGNFRSDNDGQHDSAFFELFLFQFLRRSGCDVLAVEPNLENVKGSPDFLVQDSDGQKFLVEAISPNFLTDAERGEQKLNAEIIDAINSVKVKDHYLILEEIEAPSQSVNKRKLVAALEDWIATSPNEDDIFRYSDNGASIEIKTISRPGRDVDSPDYRAIGIEMGGVSVSTPGEEVRKGLARKAAKYRDVTVPYVIALNARSMHDTEDDFLAATYGSTSVVISIGLDGVERSEPRWVRNADGLFNGGKKARKTHVSAVLLFNGVKPWQWEDRRSTVIHNAYAERPIADLTFGGDVFTIDDKVLKKVDGDDVATIFGLKP